MDIWRLRVGAVGQDGCRYVEDDRIYDDHAEYGFQYCLVLYDNVYAGVEDDSLSSDHAIPADRNNGDGQVDIGTAGKELQNEAEPMQCSTPRANEERPEVESTVTLEGVEDKEAELQHVVPRERSEDDDGGVDCLVLV